MRSYELMVIMRGTLDESAVTALTERFTALVAGQGGTIDRVDHWGKRQFAYEIKHMTEGYYTVVDFEIEADGLAELERQLRIADEVVRHKVVRPAPRVKRHPTAAHT
jgi:small subunit ribosomal protein S6